MCCKRFSRGSSPNFILHMNLVKYVVSRPYCNGSIKFPDAQRSRLCNFKIFTDSVQPMPNFKTFLQMGRSRLRNLRSSTDHAADYVISKFSLAAHSRSPFKIFAHGVQPIHFLKPVMLKDSSLVMCR